MPKFLIYNSDAVSQDGRADLKQLLQNNFEDASCDAIDWHIGQNLDGLSAHDAPTLVVPGGLMWSIYLALQREFHKIKTLVNQRGFHYIGTCAGAYLVGDSISTSGSTYEENEHGDYRQIPWAGPISTKLGIGLLAGVNTYGPLYSPSFRMAEYSPPLVNKNGSVFGFMPYSYSLKPTSSESFAGLYMGGCGFQVAVGSTVETLATYQDCLIHKQSSGYDNHIPAVLYKSGRSKNEGNVLVSSVHLETCVPNSRLLKAVQTIDTVYYARGVLSDHEAIQLKNAKDSQSQFFSDTLKRMYSSSPR